MAYLILYKGKCKQKEKEGYCNSKKEGKYGIKRLETKWGDQENKAGTWQLKGERQTLAKKQEEGRTGQTVQQLKRKEPEEKRAANLGWTTG